MTKADGDYNFPDEGCDFAPACLTCHLPICRYDMTVVQLNAWKKTNGFMDNLQGGQPIKQADRPPGRPLHHLTPTMKELILEGYRNKQIALRLDVRENTVSICRKRMRDKGEIV